MQMAEDILLIATGNDRPGVMDELSQFLLDCGGNIIDSRSAIMRGKFALLLLVRAEADAVQLLHRGLSGLAQSDIHVEIHTPDPAGASDESAYPFIFLASGKDQAGVLQRISHLMRVLNVNIANVRTWVARDQTFRIQLDLAVPRETPIAMLQDYLSYLCKELGITGELKEA